MDKNLHLATLELCKRTKIAPKQICADLGVTERWYYKFISGEIKNPGVLHVQNLHNLLSKSDPECLSPTNPPHKQQRKEIRRKADIAALEAERRNSGIDK